MGGGRTVDVLSKFIGLASRLKSIIIIIAYFIAGAPLPLLVFAMADAAGGL